MINRERQTELIYLAIIWVLAVAIQLLLCKTIDNFISDHIFRDDFVARSQFQVWQFYMAHDRLFWGYCLGFIFGWGTLKLKGQIELETALYLTGFVAAFIGVISLMLDTGHIVWRDPLFFFECAPLSALLWQLIYLGAVRFQDWQTNRANKAKDLKAGIKAVKVENPPIVPEQQPVLVEEVKTVKKEDKPIEKPKDPLEGYKSTDDWNLEP